MLALGAFTYFSQATCIWCSGSRWQPPAIVKHPQVGRATTLTRAHTARLAWKANTCVRYLRGPSRKETLAKPVHVLEVPMRLRESSRPRRSFLRSLVFPTRKKNEEIVGCIY